MNRFVWEAFPPPNDGVLHKSDEVTLYDGESKTSFKRGMSMVTPSKIIWAHHSDRISMSLPLTLVLLAEENVDNGFFKSHYKCMLHLSIAPPDHPKGPVPYSQFHSIQLSFVSQENLSQFTVTLNSSLAGVHSVPDPVPVASGEQQPLQRSSRGPPPTHKVRSGLGFLERRLEAQDHAKSQSISNSFNDLQGLINSAGEMVKLSKSISDKIKNKTGAISEDETVQFKSYLLSLGIPNPVTKSDHSSAQKFHRKLAHEICMILVPIVRKRGTNAIALTDAFCFTNRARSLDLVSPEDFVSACKFLESERQPLKLCKFDSGVTILQLVDADQASLVKETVKQIEQLTFATSDQLALQMAIPVILARETLLQAEMSGHLCRDDSMEGLFFYINTF